jgi:iron complex outermembrane receptor protein
MSGQSTTAGAPPVNIASIVTPGYTSPFTANVALNARFPLNADDMRLTARVAYTYEDGKYSFTNAIGSPFNEALKGDNRGLIDAQIAVENIPIGGAKVDLRLWGKNITNSHDFVRGVDFGQLGFGGGYFGDPATYGVTLGFKL